MLSEELKLTINNAIEDTQRRRHEYLTLEHLLLALLDDGSAAKVLEGCGADIDAVRADLEEFLEESMDEVPEDEELTTHQTIGVGRVLQRAVLHVQGAGKREVTGANLLVAIFAEPESNAAFILQAHGVTRRDVTLFISHGIAIPVLIAIAVGVVMTFIATRTRFGRYVFAIGGNPEAAELAGINTRWVIMKIFMLMGVLAAISAAISTARLNAATNALGTLDELLVIAAAVIGGTSLAGGVGTIAGAMLGAVLMQSLQSGMVLLGVDTPLQNIVVGLALVIAVWLDTMYRSRIQ